MGKTININGIFYITKKNKSKVITNLFDRNIETTLTINDKNFLIIYRLYILLENSDFKDLDYKKQREYLQRFYQLLQFTPEQIKERLPSNYMQYKTFKRFLNYIEEENDDVNVSNNVLAGNEISCNFFWKDENSVWLDMVLSYINGEYCCVIIADLGEEGKIQKQKNFEDNFFVMLRYLKSLVDDFSHIFEREKRLRVEELAETIKKFNIEE